MTTLKPMSPMAVHQLSSLVYNADQAFLDTRAMFPKGALSEVREVAQRVLSEQMRGQQFAKNEFKMLTSTSGLFLFHQLTGFGFVAEGTGGRTGELILATRGTNFESNKFDLATDVNCGLGLGPGGKLVHRGFLKTFKGYQQQLASFVTNQGAVRPTTIHCMGHSLGGALAHLNAAALTGMGFNVHLYTIGSPRVGLFPFAAELIKKIPATRIFRAVNPSDPVPMLPLFPFVHGSSQPSEFLVNSASDKVSIGAHLLNDGYAGMANQQHWRAYGHPTFALSASINNLEAELSKIGGGPMCNAKVLQLIAMSLKSLAHSLGFAALTCLQFTATAMFTVADLLSELLMKAMFLSEAMLKAARAILNGMLGFLGRAALGAGEITVAVLRWVVNQFSTELAGKANQAIQSASNRKT